MFRATLLACLIAAGGASAAPLDESCNVLKVIGGNQPEAVPGLVAEIAGRWTQANRQGAVTSLQTLLGQIEFAGGTVWRIAKLGDELEEHLVLLRLAQGEIAAMRLLYEWTPEGLKMTTMDFKRKFPEIIALQFVTQPEPLACP